MLQSEYNKKWGLKDHFHKNNAEKNGTFHMQIMLESDNIHTKIICDTYSKLLVQVEKQHICFSIYFHFEQLSIIPAVSLFLTFNKYTASGVSPFSIHHSYVSKYNYSGLTQVCIRTFEKKLIKNERWKKNHWRKTNYFIGKCAMS